MIDTRHIAYAVRVTSEEEYTQMNEHYHSLLGEYASEDLYPNHPVYFLMDFRGVSLEDPNIVDDEYEYNIIEFEDYL